VSTPVPGAAAESVEEHHSIDALSREWDELADRAGAPPFLRPGWFAAWQEAFGEADPLVLAARAGARLEGVLVLVADGRLARSATNTHTPLFGVTADAPEAVERLVADVTRRRYQRVALSHLDPSDPFYAACAAAWPGRTLTRVTARQPYLVLDGDFESYRGQLARNFRRELARRRRRLGELGQLTFDFGDGGGDLDAALAEGFRLEASGWKRDEGTAILSKPSRVQFYRSLAEWARGRGTLQLAVARLDGRPIAFDFCLVENGGVYALKGGFDPELRRYGPGFLLPEESIARAFATGARTYELLGDADDYKLNFTSDTRERVHLDAFSRSPGGRARHLAHRRVRPLVKRVRRN
jgi:CelD/BcsL family acetyltransferase involved in cellulose biosynthesis